VDCQSETAAEVGRGGVVLPCFASRLAMHTDPLTQFLSIPLSLFGSGLRPPPPRSVIVCLSHCGPSPATIMCGAIC